MLQRDDDRQAALAAALKLVADEGELVVEHYDALSVLEGADLEAFRAAWSGLPAAARERLVRALHAAAEQRLRLDYSTINRLALEDEDAAVRVAGVECALEDQSAGLFDRLLELVRRDPSQEVRRAAAEDLARFTLRGELDDLHQRDVERLRAVLLEVVHDAAEAPGVRSAALASLGYFSDARVTGELAAAFTDPSLRLGAIKGMGRSADPRWTDRLLPVLGSEDPEMRLEAARSLEEIGDERAVAPLVDLVDDPEPAVRLAVIHALGVLGGDEAREALLYALEDRDPHVRAAAEQAISALEENEGELEL